jgi:hypothetical protein
MESLDLAKMLVFGLGMQAEVIEPRELEEAVLSAAREIQNKRVNTEKARRERGSRNGGTEEKLNAKTPGGKERRNAS